MKTDMIKKGYTKLKKDKIHTEFIFHFNALIADLVNLFQWPAQHDCQNYFEYSLNVLEISGCSWRSDKPALRCSFKWMFHSPFHQFYSCQCSVHIHKQCHCNLLHIYICHRNKYLDQDLHTHTHIQNSLFILHLFRIFGMCIDISDIYFHVKTLKKKM